MDGHRMTTRNFKAFLPQPIRRPLGKLRAVVHRLVLWYQVAARIAGVSTADRVVLAKAVRRAPLTVWQGLDAWQFPMVDRDCTVVSKGVGRFRVRAATDDLFHVLPGQEPAVEAAVRDALRPGDVFVDAGSNIGYYTILASRLVGPQGQVIACEMMPETARILRNHVTMNNAGNVIVAEGALSDVPEQEIEASHPEGKFGQASIARIGQGRRLAVRTLTLEAVLQDVSQVRIMKMDLEGAELGALHGLGNALHKVESIVFENKAAPEVVTWLQANSFIVTRLDGNNALARRGEMV
jgi:FkbM family methyltransferase